MRAAIVSAAILAGACAAPQTMVPDTAPVAARTIPEIMAAIPDSDWVDLDPENTIYLELPSGRVVIELAPAYAPNHVANIKALAREGFFDAAAVVRVQENYVAQWGRPEEAPAHAFRAARASLPAEFDRPITEDLPFVRLPDRDTYADEVGFSGSFPVARGNGRTWLAHCYGMVGAGRDVSPDSGGGGELYVTIGNAPRNLDLNVTLVGRVVAGIEHLTTLRRGTGDLGFYVTPEERTPIRTMRVAADVPPAERTRLQALRTDSASFAELVEARRNRRDDWYVHPAGAIGLCNTPLPVRAAPG
ncbi:MAG: peptidylprolyl isomerase [Hydrogenophilaceae bacterium]|jgi:peptidylprolyl isomerase|nr:peptidylprolyl isomerase [Hydrogenophilaceae bacterium]